MDEMTDTLPAVPLQLVNVQTGEVLEATPENAAEQLLKARELRNRLMGLVHDCEAVLLDESRKQGTKTLHLPAGTATISGGAAVVWDVEKLRELHNHHLPPERWDDLVTMIVTYKVNAAVAKQLEAANPEYARIVGEARGWEDKPWRVSIR